MTKQFDDLVAGVANKLADDGRLIEAGWVGLKLAAIPKDAPQVQVDEMRLAFMAGAQHLFASIMGILDPGEEPTDADLRKMDLIAAELDKVRGELAARYYPTKGNG
jgi:hypothetical protein